MAALDLVSYDAVLKKYYSDERIRNMTYENRPFLAMLAKNPNVRGKSFEQPITIGAVGGRSKTFGSALSSKTPSSHRRFSIPMAKNYSLADIDGLTLQASQGDRGAFMEASTSEIDAAFRQLSNDLANDLYRDGSGLRAVVASVAAGPVVTFTNPKDTHAFEVGMTLEHVLAASTVSGAVDAVGPENVVVSEVDRSNGTITLATDFGTPIAPGDFIFSAGDASNGGARPDKVIGLGGWLRNPADITATLFNGVDRTADRTRLGGVYYDALGAGDNVEEALVNAGSAVFEEGGSPSHTFMHPTRVAELDRLLEGRGRYEKTQSSNAEIGFEAITVHTGGGTVMVMADPWCPTDRAYMLQLSTWKLVSVGAAPKLIGHDGNRVLRTNADAIEVRTGLYANLSCGAPGWNALINLG